VSIAATPISHLIPAYPDHRSCTHAITDRIRAGMLIGFARNLDRNQTGIVIGFIQER
jgi:hypothetical protein